MKGRRKLAGRQHTLAYRLYKGGVARKNTAGLSVRVKNSYRKAEFLAYNADRFLKVRVIADQDSRLKPPLIGVMEQMGRDVDIGPFFFRLEPIGILWLVSRASRQWHGNHMGKKMTEDDLYVGEAAQRPQVGLLTYRLPRVALSCAQVRREFLIFSI